MIQKNAMRFALAFLTVLPCGKGVEPPSLSPEGKALSGAQVLRCFPLVGLCIGALLVAVDYLLTWLLPPLVAAVGDVAFLAFLTGALHLDGLADSADALFSGTRDKEKMLLIMKDSRIGTMGAVTLILLIFFKVSAISALMPQERWHLLLVIPIAGRVAMLAMMASLPYARPQGGLGALFGQPDRATLGGSVAFLVAITFLLNSWRVSLGMLLMWLAGLMLWLTFCRRRLGGSTGDTLGASSELTELAMLVGGFLFWRLA